ncbi:MAG: thioredoxin domain-containing protein [Anaerolineales bacterium]|uniref:thioredoxin domain-containing protein n=1 Tax=Candidatus Villigracilis vicinus TaxID=3140679 RepID=UPI003135F18B|nr:thioredoxin domain-containing protein [Anaerolineales bacterium]
MSNQLSNSTSPYLLQHAHNPVNWHPWGKEALKIAKAENKPIFLSIGYAACHWCHVMAHESFEDPETAAFMNERFINIKVDREERPDLDNIYMQATIAMTGSGGWPMSVFLTPELKPFYAGTYFPPVRRYNMPSFMEVLSGLANAWANDREEVEKTGGKVFQHLNAQTKSENGEVLTTAHLDAIARSMQESYDWGYGGWGDAPKFPQAMAAEFLLHHANVRKTDEHAKLIKHYLYAMARGGMYDVVGGGFSRYSTDNQWRVPHFEKMLYDNALLTRTYLHAWQATRDPFYKRIVEDTIKFIAKEMTHEQGGFYSSLDADSEGEEGKFYIWTLEEVRDVLQHDSDFFEAAYGITPKGNWEGKTVLQRAIDDATLAARFKLDAETVPAKLARSHTRLYTARAQRIRPGTDDKILTAWNGLMLAAIAEAARVFENTEPYLHLAIHNAEFLLSSLRPNGQLRRAWREGKTTNEVFLEDYAALILGLLELYQTDFNEKWFSSARELADEMIEKFTDPSGGFFDTPQDGENLLFRPKDVQDNATPSGNALACEALLKLAAYTDEGKYRDLAENSLKLVTQFTLRYPLGFGRWLTAAELAAGTLKQVAAVGEAQDPSFQGLLKAIRAEYRPSVVVAASPSSSKENTPALLQERGMINGKATVYVCEGFVCKQPTTEVEILIEQLNS